VPPRPPRLRCRTREAMRVSDDFRFDASSPVGRYWLVHGVGFTVCRADGRQVGVVEQVVVDPDGQYAEHVIVRREGLFVRRRRVTLDAGAFEAVSPASQQFLVEPASSGASAASRAVGALRVREVPAFARAALRALAQAALPVGRAIRRAGAASAALVGELLRRLAGGLIVAGRLSWHGASAGAHAAVVAAGRARREAPRLESWLAARSRTAARRLGDATVIAARVLGGLSVLAAVLVAAAWRRAAALSTRRATPPHDGAPEADDPGTTQWPSDADAPLGREASGEVPTHARERPEASAGRSTPEAGSDQHSAR
jgi:hypothetical protein